MAVFALVACSSDDTQTNGLKGVAYFTYDNCPNGGCGLDKTMMVGTEEPIGIGTDSNVIPPLSVVSSAPSVVAVGQTDRLCCSQGPNVTCGQDVTAEQPCPAGDTTSITLTVDALAPGTATLSLVLGSDGSTWDSVDVSVAAPASLALSCTPWVCGGSTCDTKGDPMTTSLALALSSAPACLVSWTAADANGHDLLASSGVDLTSSALGVAGFEPPIVFSGTMPSLTSTVSPTRGSGTPNPTLLVAASTGDATLTATTGAISTTASIQVSP